MKGSIVVDSSVWIEIFREGPLASKSRKILDTHKIAGVPTASIYEIYRKIYNSVSEESALSVIAFLKQFPVLNLSLEVAVTAAEISLQHKLGMADSIMLAHAQIEDAKLITMDNDFAGIENAHVLRKD